MSKERLTATVITGPLKEAIGAMIPMTLQIIGLMPEPTECKGLDFARENVDDLSLEEFQRLAVLLPGQSTFFGGGAAPEIEVRRLT